MHLSLPPHSHSFPFRLLQVPRAFYLPHLSQVSFPTAMDRNGENRFLALFFMVDDSSILAYSELCPLSFPPRGWVFSSLTPWSGSRIAITQNSPFRLTQIRFRRFYTPNVSMRKPSLQATTKSNSFPCSAQPLQGQAKAPGALLGPCLRLSTASRTRLRLCKDTAAC